MRPLSTVSFPQVGPESPADRPSRSLGPQKKERPPVTVCIASLCTLPNSTLGVLGISDRMLTAGDIEFEQPQLKVWGIRKEILILLAGDTAGQTSICTAVETSLLTVPAVTVQEVAERYASEFIAFRQR